MKVSSHRIDSEPKIDFQTLRKALKESCLFSGGVEKVEEMIWSEDADIIRKNLHLTNELMQIIQSPDPFPVSDYFDFTQSLEKITPLGTYLEEEEVWEIFLCVEAFNLVDNYIKSRSEEYHELNASRLNSSGLPLTKLIRQKFDDNGRLKDSASPELNRLRKQKKKVEGSVNKLINKIFREAASRNYVPEGMSVSIRNGRAVIPILSEHKRKIKGIIHDYSATGSMIFLEPDEVVETTNKIQDLHHEEKKEVVKLLLGISDELRNEKESLLEILDFLGLIDFTRAKAKLALKLNAIMPKIGDGKKWRIVEGRHPLLVFQGKEVMPLDLHLNEAERILLISGPNAGGKSVALKTAGLFQYMFQCGLLIPVKEGSEFKVFKNMYIDIGDQQSLENDLSTYSSHLRNMREVLTNADENSLVLIDEFGSGTDPKIGGAIAESILEGIVKCGAWGVITTHYANLKYFAEQSSGIINGAMLFDKKNLKPFYILEQGRQGGSFALEVARETGLPIEIVDRAKELAGSETVSLEEILAKLDKERNELTDRLSELERQQNEAKLNRERYFQLKEELENKSSELLREASEKAENLLRDTNKEIENTIRHIKENKAERKETRKVREKLDQFRKKKVKTLPKIPSKTTMDIGVGDRVEIANQSVTGEVMELRGKDAVVLVGNIRTKVKISELAKTTRKVETPRTTAYQFDRGLHQISNSIDLRGMRADEVIGAVEKFIDDAIIAGLNEVSVLHGKGNGILRKVVRERLRKIKQVEKFEDEHVERGGDGVTIVYLK